jgi:signal transduction histidine kinase
MTEAEPVTADELAQFPLFEGESREAMEWIASQLQALRLEAGEFIVRAGEPVTDFLLILEGELRFRRDGNPYGGVFVRSAGQAAGVLPFSRIKTAPVDGIAVQPTRLGSMPRSGLPELVYRAPLLAQRLVGEMVDRTREVTRLDEGSNRLLALGKLAAGLAHELNNPASAAVRSSARLREALAERRKYGIALSTEPLPVQARQILSELRDSIDACKVSPGMMDPLERTDRESDLAEWLESVGVPADLAPGLADAAIDVKMLEPLASIASGEALELVLRILNSDHEILCLSREVEEAVGRISDLVQAVKIYSYMDQSAVSEVDIEQGIDVTLRMFQHQLKHDIQVERQSAPKLPRIMANGSALNQVWTNLIDNAIDAMAMLPPEQSKVLTVRTCQEPDGVLVEIADTGPGIPLDVQSRIFDPFFTTKPVGEGTGLGLDIVQRIVRNHRGSIHITSNPGRTVFQVRLPL